MLLRLCLFISIWLSGTYLTIAGAHNLDLTVHLHGLSTQHQQYILPNLSIYKAIQEHKLSSHRVAQLHQNTLEEIKYALSTLGFYHAEVYSRLTQINTSKMAAEYYITLNQATHIQTSTLKLLNRQFLPNALAQQLEQQLLKPGIVLQLQAYNAMKQQMLILLQDHGFIEAKFSYSKLQVDRSNNQAYIELHIDVGVQYFFGNIEFSGSKYQSKFLQKFVHIQTQPAEAYSVTKVHTLHQALDNYNIFSKIRVDHKAQSKQKHIIDLTVRLVDKPLDNLSGSLGYGSDTSYRGGVAWQHAMLNGSRTKLACMLAKNRQQLTLQYAIPGRDPTRHTYLFGSSLINEKIRDLESKRAEISVWHKTANTWQFGVYAMQERFRLLDIVPSTTSTYLLPSMKAAWQQNISENHGKKIETELRAGGRNLGSSTNFVQAQCLIKYMHGLGAHSRYLLKLHMGALNVNKFERVPWSLRFFAGGDTSVRGFAYRSLGPKVVKDNVSHVVGGKYLCLTSLEVDRKLYKELRGAVFVDAGNAMNHFVNKFPMGAGVGVHWVSSLGSFRIDLAKQIAYKISHKLRLHITFGTDI
jgi:translocation and assembly module TamA